MTYYHAEDDLWFDQPPCAIWPVATPHAHIWSGIGNGYVPPPCKWTCARPRPVVNSQMPIVVTESRLMGKVVYGDRTDAIKAIWASVDATMPDLSHLKGWYAADRDQQSHMGVEFD